MFRSSLKELEDLIAEHVVIFSKWRTPHLLQLILQNGVIVGIHLNKLGDLSRIVLDRWLVGRLTDHPTDCWFTARHLVIVYLGRCQKIDRKRWAILIQIYSKLFWII